MLLRRCPTTWCAARANINDPWGRHTATTTSTIICLDEPAATTIKSLSYWRKMFMVLFALRCFSLLRFAYTVLALLWRIYHMRRYIYTCTMHTPKKDVYDTLCSALLCFDSLCVYCSCFAVTNISHAKIYIHMYYAYAQGSARPVPSVWGNVIWNCSMASKSS